MKKLVAIFIMFLLTVQTVQFAISTPPNVTSCSISLDEDLESKEHPVKKLQKEYPYWETAEAFLLSSNALYPIYKAFIPICPFLQNPTPPPNFSC